MRVVLKEDIDKLGQRGAIVKVADGYARNFLLPKGKALLATDGNLKTIDREKRRYVVRVAKEKEEMENLARRIGAVSCTLVRKVGEHDVLYGSVTAADIAEHLEREGIAVKGVRLDSGDLATLARHVRRILDEGGLPEATIFASGNLDERRLHDLLAAGAPIDGFGIGSSLVTSDDAPVLDAVYKLQEYAGKPRRKRSSGKATWPGRKQVYRHTDTAGCFGHDVISVEGDEQPGEPLLVPVARNGRRLHAQESLDTIRARAAEQLAKLPARLRALDDAATPYRVEIAPALRKLAERVDRATGETPALLR